MPHQCTVCKEWVPGSQDQHKCSGTAVPSMKPLWGLASLSSADMNGYTFPDLATITGQTQKILMIVSQQNSCNDRSPSTLAQWKIGVDHPAEFVCSGPTANRYQRA